MYTVVMEMIERDALDLLIAFIRPFSIAILIYYFMRKLLPNRMNNYSLIAVAVIYALWTMLRNQGQLVLYGTGFHLWMSIFVNVLTFSVLIFLFKGKFWRRAAVYWYFFNRLLRKLEKKSSNC